MCRQEYIKCLNTKCDGFAQLRALQPCENIPNCEIEYIRVSRNSSSTAIYCPTCMTVTREERKIINAKARYESKKAKAESPEARERRTNVADLGAREQPAGSSTSRGGGVPPNSGNPSSISKGQGSGAPPFLIHEEFEFLRAKLPPFQSQQRTELSDGPTIDAPQTRPYPEFTPCAHEASPGAWVFYRAAADATFPPGPSATRWEHLPTLEEIIELANADVEAGLRFPGHYYHGMSPRPPASTFQLPAHYPSSSTDSVLLEMHLVFRNARDPIRNPHDAEQLLRDVGVWPDSSEGKWS